MSEVLTQPKEESRDLANLSLPLSLNLAQTQSLHGQPNPHICQKDETIQ